MFEFLSYSAPSSAMGPGGTFGYAEVNYFRFYQIFSVLTQMRQVNMAGHMACIQIGTHGKSEGW